MMRLDKYLAHAKWGSRKVVKQAIRKGYVCVNGEVITKDDTKIDEEKDVISIDGVQVSYQEFYYLMLNKPQGYICSSIDEGYPSVLNLIEEDYAYDLFSVGRLDVDTEGFVLLSNDGKFSHHITSPKHHIEKVYEVKLEKTLDAKDIQKLEEGVMIDEEITLPSRIDVMNDKHVYLHIYEGRYHQVKRMFHAVNNEVIYLNRVQIGSVTLDKALALGEYRELSVEELQLLKGEA